MFLLLLMALEGIGDEKLLSAKVCIGASPGNNGVAFDIQKDGVVKIISAPDLYATWSIDMYYEGKMNGDGWEEDCKLSASECETLNSAIKKVEECADGDNRVTWVDSPVITIEIGGFFYESTYWKDSLEGDAHMQELAYVLLELCPREIEGLKV